MSSNSSKYILYAHPNTYSIGVHLLLEESGVPYRIIDPKVDPSLTSAAFLQASPHGRVPALILPNGTTMCESNAIALHLADSLSEQQFSIHSDSMDRGQYLQWLFYLSSTLQPDVLITFHPEFYFTDAAHQSALTTAAEKRLAQVLDVLEQEYSQKSHRAPWMFEHGPTAVDFSLATVLLWPECFTPNSDVYPALSDMLQAVSMRASFKRIMPWHQRTTDTPPHREAVGS